MDIRWPRNRILLNSLFGKGKEPFWQQAYTNLIKFTVILHKDGFGYVTLFDVYECVISSESLKKRSKRPNRTSSANPSLASQGNSSSNMPRSLQTIGFEADETGHTYRVADSAQAREALQKLAVEPTVQCDHGSTSVDPDRKEQLEAVKRWYNGDWTCLWLSRPW